MKNYQWTYNSLLGFILYLFSFFRFAWDISSVLSFCYRRSFLTQICLRNFQYWIPLNGLAAVTWICLMCFVFVSRHCKLSCCTNGILLMTLFIWKLHLYTWYYSKLYIDTWEFQSSAACFFLIAFQVILWQQFAQKEPDLLPHPIIFLW